MPHAIRARLSGTALIALLGCGGDPSGPEPPDPPAPSDLAAVRIAPGDTVTGTLLPANTGAVFTLQLPAAGEVAFFLQPESGFLGYELTDSVSGARLDDGGISAQTAAGELYRLRTVIVPAAAGQVLALRVSRSGTSTVGFRIVAYRVDRAPEIADAAVASPDTVADETLENSADIDTFTFQASAGDELIAFLQPLSPNSDGVIQLVIEGPASDTLANFTRGPGDELESPATGRFAVAADGAYRATVRAFEETGPQAEALLSGAYRLQVRRIDPAPEAVLPALSPGDTLAGEAIDHVGDVDEFLVPVTAGREYNVFLQTGASAGVNLVANVLDASGATLKEVVSPGGTAPLAEQFTGNIVAPATGPMRIRVSGYFHDRDLDRGPYRLFVYPVDPAPETAAVALTPDVFSNEAIDFPGDVDTFVVPVPATGVSRIAIEKLTPAHSITIKGPGIDWRCFFGNICGIGRFRQAAPVTVELRADHEVTKNFQGPYRITVTAIDTLPEGRSATVTLGETVTERIDPFGDLDVYSFTYSAGQLLTLTFDQGAPGIHLQLPAVGQTFGDVAGYFTLPASGTYPISATGLGGGANPTNVGTYTFRLAEAPTTAEGGTGTISVGDSITSEATEVFGDVDEVVLMAPAGTEFQAYLRNAIPLIIEALAPGELLPLRTGSGATGRVIMPAGGQLRLRVRQPLNAGHSPFTGEYDLVVHAIDRAPETAPVALTKGVPVQTERIEFVGDVDEFTYAGTAGEQIAVTISAPLTFDFERVMVEVVDPVGGAVLGSADENDGEVSSTGVMTLPGSRDYVVRVRGRSDTAGFGGYRVGVVGP